MRSRVRAPSSPPANSFNFSIAFPSMPVLKALSVTQLYQNPSIWPRCTRTPFVFVSPTIQSVEGLAHHVELGLAVPFENACVPLPEHQRDKVICHSARTEARGKRVTQLIEGEIRDAGTPQRGAPNLL